jgi:glycerol kinase
MQYRYIYNIDTYVLVPQAVIAGLTKSTTTAEIYRAALESVALRLGVIVKLMSGAS